MRMPRPRRTSRFSNGMRAMCARIRAVSDGSVGSSGPAQPMRLRYPSRLKATGSALDELDLGAVRIFDERVMHHARRELQVGPGLQHLDALEIRERLVEVRHAPADVID